jgi:hypothetical protein
MFADIKNLTKERLFLSFNSGRTHHLAPLATLQAVPHPEIKGNPKIEKLRQRHLIALEASNDAESGAEASQPQTRKPPKRQNRATPA